MERGDRIEIDRDGLTRHDGKRRHQKAADGGALHPIVVANSCQPAHVAIPSRTEQILAFLCPNAHARRKLYPKRKPLCLGRHRGLFSALREFRTYERIIFFRTPAVTANRADPRSTMLL